MVGCSAGAYQGHGLRIVQCLHVVEGLRLIIRDLGLRIRMHTSAYASRRDECMDA